jgi:hypothetical protein
MKPSKKKQRKLYSITIESSYTYPLLIKKTWRLSFSEGVVPDEKKQLFPI